MYWKKTASSIKRMCISKKISKINSIVKSISKKKEVPPLKRSIPKVISAFMEKRNVLGDFMNRRVKPVSPLKRSGPKVISDFIERRKALGNLLVRKEKPVSPLKRSGPKMISDQEVLLKRPTSFLDQIRQGAVLKRPKNVSPIKTLMDQIREGVILKKPKAFQPIVNQPMVTKYNEIFQRRKAIGNSNSRSKSRSKIRSIKRRVSPLKRAGSRESPVKRTFLVDKNQLLDRLKGLKKLNAHVVKEISAKKPSQIDLINKNFKKNKNDDDEWA
jgi:hypothetical protein